MERFRKQSRGKQVLRLSSIGDFTPQIAKVLYNSYRNNESLFFELFFNLLL